MVLIIACDPKAHTAVQIATSHVCRDLIVAYWAVANYLGNVQVTNKHGHLVGHVKNHGRDPNHPLTRLYSTNAAQPYHCDRGADIIGLCCVHQAKSGGGIGKHPCIHSAHAI